MDWRKELEALKSETVALVSATPPTALDATKALTPRPPRPIDLVASIPNEPSRQAPGPFNFGPPEREKLVSALRILRRTKSACGANVRIILHGPCSATGTPLKAICRRAALSIKSLGATASELTFCL